MGYIPDINVVLAYDAINVLAKAINDAGTTDGAAVRDALSKIQGFEAISGPVSFRENGEGGTNSLVFRIEKGKIILY